MSNQADTERQSHARVREREEERMDPRFCPDKRHQTDETRDQLRAHPPPEAQASNQISPKLPRSIARIGNTEKEIQHRTKRCERTRGDVMTGRGELRAPCKEKGQCKSDTHTDTQTVKAIRLGTIQRRNEDNKQRKKKKAPQDPSTTVKKTSHTERERITLLHWWAGIGRGSSGQWPRHCRAWEAAPAWEGRHWRSRACGRDTRPPGSE